MKASDLAGFELDQGQNHHKQQLSWEGGGSPALVVMGKTHIFEGRRFRKCLFEKTKIRTKKRPEMAHYKHNWVDISGLWYVAKISVVHWEQKLFF